jgi:hypothetical protein
MDARSASFDLRYFSDDEYENFYGSSIIDTFPSFANAEPAVLSIFGNNPLELNDYPVRVFSMNSSSTRARLDFSRGLIGLYEALARKAQTALPAAVQMRGSVVRDFRIEKLFDWDPAQSVLPPVESVDLELPNGKQPALTWATDQKRMAEVADAGIGALAWTAGGQKQIWIQVGAPKALYGRMSFPALPADLAPQAPSAAGAELLGHAVFFVDRSQTDGYESFVEGPVMDVLGVTLPNNKKRAIDWVGGGTGI